MYSKDFSFLAGITFACVLMITTWHQHSKISQNDARIAQLESRDNYGSLVGMSEPCKTDSDCRNDLLCFCYMTDFDFKTDTYKDGCETMCLPDMLHFPPPGGW